MNRIKTTFIIIAFIATTGMVSMAFIIALCSNIHLFFMFRLE